MGSAYSSRYADMSTLDRQAHGWPHFPPEIWLRILRTSTDVPDPLVYPNLLLSDSRTNQRVLSEHAHQRYRESLVCAAHAVISGPHVNIPLCPGCEAYLSLRVQAVVRFRERIHV